MGETLQKKNMWVTSPFKKIQKVTDIYRPFHKTLPRSSAFVNRISVRFFETGCIVIFDKIDKIDVDARKPINMLTKTISILWKLGQFDRD